MTTRPEIVPALPGRTVLIFALSGLGKSTLARSFPGHVYDGDDLLYSAVAAGFPDLEPRARLQAWRDLCRKPPWVEGGESLALWASVRRSFTADLLAVLRDGEHPVVVTSLFAPPWPVSAYYGMRRGHYVAHLRMAGREADNAQDEAMNERLEGYAPLVRMEPGDFIAQRPEIAELLNRSGA